MPGLDDWTLTPLRIVDRFFEECGPAGDWKQKSQEFFENEASKPTVLKRIPWVNETPLHHLRSNQVVRFRGMVQDMFDNEFFLDKYEVKNTKTGAVRLRPGRYKDIAECGVGEELIMDSPRCEAGDRLTYYCVPVPGENQWVKDIYKERNPCLDEGSTSSGSSRLKRYMGNEEENAENCQGSSGTGQTADDQTESMEAEASSASGENKRIRTGGNENQQNGGPSTSNQGTAPDSTTNMNFPLPDMKGTPCLLKIYGEQSLPLNEMIEVVGILSVDPALAATPEQEGSDDCIGTMDVEEEAAHCPPPSLVPRIHALTVRPLKHTNPLLPPDPHNSADAGNVIGEMRETREVLRQILQEAFMGDALAAELIIAHLVSSVYIRQDVVAVGKYSVNVSGIKKVLLDQQYTTHLYQFLSTLVTQSHFLPMTLSNMNTTTFIPKKDYKANRLVSGILQLSKHTHFVVDETALTAGQLDSKGVQNLTALGNVINWQKIDYDFQYHPIEQHTNIPVLILSEGKSMITSDAQIRLNPAHTDVSAAFGRVESKLTPDVLRKIRAYLTAARLIDYELSDDMQKMVQDDFVESRRSDDSVSAEDLHNLLIIARLVTVSCGEKNLTSDVWRSVKILENERKLRLTSTS